MSSKSTQQVAQEVLEAIPASGAVNTLTLARQFQLDHQVIVGAVKSLQIHPLVIAAVDKSETLYVLTAEGQESATLGSPEARVFNLVPATGSIDMAALQALQGFTEPGYKTCMKNKWLQLTKTDGTVVVSRKVPAIVDSVQAELTTLVNGGTLPDDVAANLAKRTLAVKQVIKSLDLSRGRKYTTKLEKLETELTQQMLADGSWQTKKFKPVMLNALGAPLEPGHLHPLLKVRSEFRSIFLDMGFEEMPTNNFVENSFWNFDALFQPQQHPARDMHDTFFMSEPQYSTKFPEDYLTRVQTMHEKGGHGSQGYRYDWSREEASTNILRTHTTAVSARMLYKLAQQKEFKPTKYFSIDRVFRNETLDATHLAEFHQIEGVIADYNLTLGNLISTINEFFQRMGMSEITFKPAYNPYTEPSMEIFAYHPMLKKVVEVGNSGVFRPEMLLPMGLPEDVVVIAWGLSVERPTMIKYGYDNIRDMVGPAVDLEQIKKNPMCRL